MNAEAREAREQAKVGSLVYSYRSIKFLPALQAWELQALAYQAWEHWALEYQAWGRRASVRQVLEYRELECLQRAHPWARRRRQAPA